MNSLEAFQKSVLEGAYIRPVNDGNWLGAALKIEHDGEAFTFGHYIGVFETDAIHLQNQQSEHACTDMSLSWFFIPEWEAVSAEQILSESLGAMLAQATADASGGEVVAYYSGSKFSADPNLLRHAAKLMRDMSPVDLDKAEPFKFQDNIGL